MAAFVFGALLLAACLGAAWWFSQQKTDDAARMVRIILGSGALIAGVVICLRGAVILGGPIGLFGLGMLGRAIRVPHRRSRSSGGSAGTAPATGMSLAEAREILGVDASADAETIRQAHRRLMKKLHPDTGEGSAALARQVQDARDLLLDHLNGKS
ncbi:DnaJ domain-containing protein [Maricaulis sp.]|uniref:J domain-containing protein n=1 Tax=Maricaulis sp. TaxID=1486257 RepID=UPI0025BB0983|nr:DnaJ domain-containing protein [Maricaulis sp.]